MSLSYGVTLPEDDTAGVAAEESKPAKSYRWAIAAGVAILLVAAAALIFFGVGQWLVVSDPLVHADAIVVLSGELPDRALEAARIYQAGYADQIWVSQGVSPVEQLKAMKIYYLGEDFYNEKVLLANGVHADSIHLLPKPASNTEEEVREIVGELREHNLHRVILVTSKVHTRRARTIWHKIVGNDPGVTVRPANDDYDGAHWWRHTHDALDVMRETLGLLNAWAGFPLRPPQN